MLVIKNIKNIKEFDKINNFLKGFKELNNERDEEILNIWKDSYFDKDRDNYLVIAEPFKKIALRNIDDNIEETFKPIMKTFNMIDVNEINKEIVEKELEHHKELKKFSETMDKWRENKLQKDTLNNLIKDNKEWIIKHPIYKTNRKNSFVSAIELLNGAENKNAIDIILKNDVYHKNKHFYDEGYNESQLHYLNFYGLDDKTLKLKLILKGEENIDLYLEDNLDFIEHLISLGNSPISNTRFGNNLMEYNIRYKDGHKKDISEKIIKKLLKNPEVIEYYINIKKVSKKEEFNNLVKEYYGNFDKLLKESKKYTEKFEKSCEKFIKKEDKLYDKINFDKELISKKRKNYIDKLKSSYENIEIYRNINNEQTLE